jgi:hypothetical protein
MRAGLDDWVAFWKRNAKVDLFDLTSDPTRLIEVMQRRNVFVHARGVVTPQYAAKVFGSPPIGSQLRLDRTYVEAALQELLGVGSLLAALVWAQLVPTESARAGQEIERLNYWCMTTNKWSTVRVVSTVAATKFTSPERRRLVFLFNRWLACKRLDTLGSVRDDIENFDASALTLEFRAARAALLDDVDAALSLADRALENDDLSAKDMREWPVFEELRQDERFRSMAFVVTEPPELGLDIAQDRASLDADEPGLHSPGSRLN